MTVKRTTVTGNEDAVARLTEAYFREANSLGRDWFDEDDYGPDIQAIIESDIKRLRAGEPSEPLCLAYSNDSIAGMGQLHRHDWTTITAKRVFVSQPHRGHGLGTALVERMLEAARTDGFETFHLNVAPYHDRARKLYRSFGFKRVTPPEWTHVSPEYREEWQFLERSLDSEE